MLETKFGSNAQFPICKFATNFACFIASALPPVVKLYMPNVTNMYTAFHTSTGAEIIDVKVSDNLTTLLFAYRAVTAHTIYHRSSTHNVGDWRYAFYYAPNLQHIYADLDPSNSGEFTDTFTNVSLITITFVPATIKKDIRFISDHLSTASLLSIANGLDETISGKTLTHTSTAKAAMDALMVDNIGGVAVEGTAMSLSAFVTTIKGWSLATE